MGSVSLYVHKVTIRTERNARISKESEVVPMKGKVERDTGQKPLAWNTG